MKSLAVVFIDMDYFKIKERYIMDNYEITHYFSCYEEMVGELINEKTILPMSEFMNIKGVQNIVIAMPLSIILKKLNLIFFQMGFKAENIVLLFDKPNYFGEEAVCDCIKDIKYNICPTGDIICEVEGRSIIISSPNEMYILREVYGLRCYDVFFPCESYIVVDIGMNIGVSSLFFAGLERVSKIYSFEPFLETYNTAIENLGLNHVLDKVIPLQFGLGATSRKMELSYLSSIKGMMSIIVENGDVSDRSKHKTTIEIVDAAEAFNEIIQNNPDKKFVFKIDCEGAEYEIFERLDETDMLKNIDIIVMEWHNMGGRDITEVERVLQKNNFIYQVNGFRKSVVGMILAVKGK